MAAEEAKHAKLEAIYQKEKEKYMAELKQVESENELVAKQIDRLNAEAASELGRSHKSIETLALEYVQQFTLRATEISVQCRVFE